MALRGLVLRLLAIVPMRLFDALSPQLRANVSAATSSRVGRTSSLGFWFLRAGPTRGNRCPRPEYPSGGSLSVAADYGPTDRNDVDNYRSAQDVRYESSNTRGGIREQAALPHR